MTFVEEMTAVNDADVGIRHIALESFCAGRGKEWIVLAPYPHYLWLVLSEIGLPLRIRPDIVFIVAQESKLDIERSFSRSVVGIQSWRIRANVRR